MTLARHAKRKDANQAAIVRALRLTGVEVWILDTPCDLLTNWAGLWQPLEVKRDHKAKFSSPEQETFCKERNVPVVTSETEALKALGII